jgi:hypothetical protein
MIALGLAMSVIGMAMVVVFTRPDLPMQTYAERLTLTVLTGGSVLLMAGLLSWLWGLL